jgi:hypothetical protein
VIVGALGRGGAERQAVLAVHAMETVGVDARLFVCSSPLDQLEDARDLNVQVDAPTDVEHVAAQISRLRIVLGTFAPDGVVTFLPSAGARYAIARLLIGGGRKAAWLYGVRGNYTSSEFLEPPVRSAIRQVCLHAADRIVVNSASLANNTIASAPFAAPKLEIVPNVLLPSTGDTDAAAARRLLAAHVSDVADFPSPARSARSARAQRAAGQAFHTSAVASDGTARRRPPTGPDCDRPSAAARAPAHRAPRDLAGRSCMRAGSPRPSMCSSCPQLEDRRCPPEGASCRRRHRVARSRTLQSCWRRWRSRVGSTPDALASAILRVLAEPDAWQEKPWGARPPQGMITRGVGGWLRVLETCRDTR